jgi:Sulfotransferase family
MLRQHPQIHLGLKEPRYFAVELRERDVPRPRPTPTTLEEYAAWFARASPDQLIGDVSPDYLWSAYAPALIAEARPDARIIAILREPVSYLRSLHMQLLQSYVEVEPDLAKALELEDARRQGRELPTDTYWPNALLYSERVRYVEQLRRFEALFPRERMQVLLYDDYRSDNQATVRSVLRFLGVDEDVPLEAGEFNASRQVQSPRAHALLRNLIVADRPAAKAVKSAIKAVTPMRLRQNTLHTVQRRYVMGTPTPPDETFVRELRARVAPEVVALSEYLDRDLVTLWGYDELV